MTLPKRWAEAELLNVINLHDSRRIPLNREQRAALPGKFPYYGANGQVDTVGDYLFEGDYLLLAEDGGYFEQPKRGVAYAVTGRFWVNNHAHILSTADGVLQNYLLRFLNTLNWMSYVSGTTRLKLTQEGMRRISVPLPPTGEQRRIVAKLDTLTARLTRARAELDRLRSLSVTLRRMASSRCFDTDAMPTAPLGDLLEAVEAGKNLRCDERPPREGELGVVKVSAVTWGRFDPRQAKTLPSSYAPPAKARINRGDFLISRANTLELVGASVIVEDEPSDLFLSDKVLRLVMPDAEKRWVMRFLRSPAGRAQIERFATGNQLSMRNISQQALSRIMLPYPSDRDSRLARLEAIFARADRLEADAARVGALLERLEAAILARAFRGDLVPQNPDDEPASALLDRIRDRRAAGPKPLRRRRADATSA